MRDNERNESSIFSGKRRRRHSNSTWLFLRRRLFRLERGATICALSFCEDMIMGLPIVRYRIQKESLTRTFIVKKSSELFDLQVQNFWCMDISTIITGRKIAWFGLWCKV